MKLTYTGPHDAIEVVVKGATTVVARGESVNVPADQARDLLDQPSNWKSTTTPKES